jgi:putative peptide zinc metalloprotease protein
MSVEAPLHSSLWYRVAPLRPQLLTRARLHRHHYRGERWYLLQDPATGKVHRFSKEARSVLAAMDGSRTVEELWQLAKRQLGDLAPTQDEIIQMLGQLHASDLLASDAAPDVLEVFERGRKQERAKRNRSWVNPMALRLPLWDPGRFLDRHADVWAWLWSWRGAMIWLAVVVPALVMMLPHWPELTSNLSDRVLAVDNLLLIWLVFPIVKALHEMGHATCARAAGGEVHDMGLMLLVLMPVPYVDATSSTVLRSKWRRATVGAAGMLVELFVAALAFYVWQAVEPGLLRAICFNVMLVAGVSTLVFNGNPLLRYDAYYILADVIELPNLGQRSARHWGYLLERLVLRVRDASPVARSTSESWWLGSYGLLSAMYRVFVTFAIALFIGSQFFFIGVALALWAVVMMIGAPLAKLYQHLESRQSLRERRMRMMAIGAPALMLLVALGAFLPAPRHHVAEGVVWLPERSILRTGAPGFVSKVELAPGSLVQPGDVIVHRMDPALEALIRMSAARVAELEARFGAEFVNDRARAEQVREMLHAEQSALERARARAAGLPVVAEVAGRVTIASPVDLPGRWHAQGEVLGHVLGADEPIVRVVVSQADADLVGALTRTVSLRLADELGTVLAGRIVRQVPAGQDEVPSRALVSSGGGKLATDPRDPEGRRTLERVFQIDVALAEPIGRAAAIGQRVHVRFDLEPAPLLVQAWHSARRLFLRHFDV